MDVLVVHPEGPWRDATTATLAHGGFGVRTAENPFQALSEVAGPEEVGAVVLDLGAFAERDLEVIPVLRGLRPGLVIVLTYPAARRELAARGLVLGADAHLPRPAYPDELPALLRRALGRVSAPPPGIEQGSALDLLCRLARDVAHEVNNALQVIHLLEGEDARRASARIHAQIARIQAVMELLVGIGRAPESARARVDLGELLDEAAARAGVEPDRSGAETAVVRGLAELLGTVLEGLLRRVEAAGSVPRVACRVGGRSPASGIEIRVTSDEPDDSERTPAGQDNSHGPLFLTFCRVVAALHGGRFETESASDGTVDHVLSLPGLAGPDAAP